VRTEGVKFLDGVLQNCQIHWLVLRHEDCPDEHSERRVILSHFRVPHEPWTLPAAFVRPVRVRRSRRRVLFYQESGVRP
jgi:hypothetical protein